MGKEKNLPYRDLVGFCIGFWVAGAIAAIIAFGLPVESSYYSEPDYSAKIIWAAIGSSLLGLAAVTSLILMAVRALGVYIHALLNTKEGTTA